MSTFRLGSTALAGINKVGEMKPDADGWYDVYLGALEFPNSFGATYETEAAMQIINGDNIFTRRIRAGRLFGELGHPRMLPGMTEKQFAARLMDLVEQNESHAIKEVIIDTNAKDKHGRRIIAFRGKIKPSGRYGYVTEQKLKDKDINLCFSLRAFSDDVFVNGKMVRKLKCLVSFDQVGEPGIDIADKYNAPSLESYQNNNLDTVVISEGMLNSMINDPSKYAMESSTLVNFCKEMKSAMSSRNAVYSQPKALKQFVPNWCRSY